MAVFIDRHRINDIDPPVRKRLEFEAQQGIRDVSGTVPLGDWVEDGTIYCLLEAPDADSVCRHHRDRGLLCDDVHLLPEVTGRRPPSDQDRLAIMAAIQRLWHAPVGT